MKHLNLKNDAAALVLEPGGGLQLVLPKAKDSDPVPLHHQLAVALALRLKDAKWCREQLQFLHSNAVELADELDDELKDDPNLN